MLALFGLRQTELIIILVVVFILFGHRLPGVMRSLGRGMMDWPMDGIYEHRRWRRQPSPSTLDMWVIGGGILLMLAVFAVVIGQVLLRR
jgi:hypothetical protein